MKRGHCQDDRIDHPKVEWIHPPYQVVEIETDHRDRTLREDLDDFKQIARRENVLFCLQLSNTVVIHWRVKRGIMNEPMPQE